MGIPDYRTVMLPFLKQISDGQEYRVRDITEALAQYFQLSEEERNTLLASGKQTVFENRVAWAKTYLKHAGLIESPKRAICRITDRGKQVLRQNVSAIDDAFLMQYPEFRQFKLGNKNEGTDISVEKEQHDDQTPEELIQQGYQKIRQDLADELLQRIKACPPSFFERLVVELLVKMGYGGSLSDAGQAIGRSGDEGIDGIIKEDKLGLDVIYIQAKRWEGPVGRPEIQKFAGALQGQRAKKGIFITTSSYTKEASDFVKNIDSKIILIDGPQLAEYMIDYDLGVSSYETFILKKLDEDYFSE